MPPSGGIASEVGEEATAKQSFAANRQAEPESDYVPFEGICLTDTFQLGEEGSQADLKGETFKQNSERVERQKRAPLKVIFGNPPYSVGQRSANDNAQNQKYTRLDNRISDTYAKLTSATNKNSLYDSYFKAFRWSTDRLDDNGGVICFVSNGSWIDGNAQDGFRKSLEKEFSSVYVFNLRGNARTSGEQRRKEKGNVFGEGSRTPISITLLVKKPKTENNDKKAVIHYHDIGDYLNREDKLALLKKVELITKEEYFNRINPNEHGDWIGTRSDAFTEFISLGSKGDVNRPAFFSPLYSNGIKTQRDAWCYNSSPTTLAENMERFVSFYNEQRNEFHEKLKGDSELKVRDFVSKDSKQISWTRALEGDIGRNREIDFSLQRIVSSLYRPFFKQHLYFSRALNEVIYKIHELFPTPETSNLVICVPAPGGNQDLSVLITDQIPDLHLNGDTQCFPLYYYEENRPDNPTLFDTAGEPQFVRRDGVSDFIAKRAKEQYGTAIKKEDIFYYVYGFLHSPEYRRKFANDLKKMLPRIPLVDELADFVAFSKAGRALAQLHLNYEKVSAYPDVIVEGDKLGKYAVTKMRFVSKTRKDTILYNNSITISCIPPKAYDYVINGKSAIEWIMERYQVKTDKASGITNDPNDWSTETGNERYILDLLLSIINVSVQTVDIVERLPKVKFD